MRIQHSIVICLLELFVVLFFGCSSNPPPGGGDGRVADGGALDGGISDHFLPAGSTLTPFLSASPEHRFAAAEQVLQPNRDYFAVLETDAGRIVIDLYEDKTPITVNSFVFLALHHYFDGAAFHRVIDGFVAQGGDPNTIDGARSTWGTGGPGYTFGVEIDSALTFDRAGVLGMARASSPTSNGSQFFITFAAQVQLDGAYTIFGAVTEGMDVLPNIVRGEPPMTPTRMRRVYVVEKAK